MGEDLIFGRIFMNTGSEAYQKYVKAHAKRSPLGKDCLFAFLIGGAICAFAEFLFHIYMWLGVSEEITKTLVPVTLIFLAGLLTGLGVFDDIAKVAGAGTLVPITGFSNAMCAPAIDDKSEGLIMGLGAKLFTIAGPVIVYGTLTSIAYGIVYFIVRLWM